MTRRKHQIELQNFYEEEGLLYGPGLVDKTAISFQKLLPFSIPKILNVNVFT